MAPISMNGSIVIYQRLIQPAFQKYQTRIDSTFSKAAEKANNVFDDAIEKAKDLAAEHQLNRKAD